MGNRANSLLLCLACTGLASWGPGWKLAWAADASQKPGPAAVEESAALIQESAAALRRRDYERAYKLATRALHLNPLSAQAWNFRAIADLRTQRYGQAVHDSTFALGLAPGNTSALQSRSQAFNMRGKYRMALRDANNILALDPSNGLAHVNRAFALAGLGTPEAAREELRRAATLDSRFEALHQEALRSPGQSGLLELFQGTAVEEAPAVDVRHSEASLRAAQNAMSTGDDHLAIESASRAIAADPRNLRAYNLRAIAYQHLRDYASELADVDAGLKVDAQNIALLNSKATALNRMKRHKQALKAADLVVQIDPNNYYGHYMRAEALAGLGDREAMIEALRKAADLNPGLYKKLQEALQLPMVSDASFLFPEEKNPIAPEGAPPIVRWGLAPTVVLLGCLVAFGAFQISQRSSRKAAPTVPGLLKGQYRTLRKIGSGGMGLVYEGTDISLDRPVAIKKMRDEIRTDRRERERFVTEAKLVATLHHPNIVDIYSIVEEGEDVYLVFEYVSGKTVQENLSAKGRFAFPEALPILKGVASALDYAHGRHVIHRDLKPSNIMISDQGEAKVMDFGVARQAKEALTRIMTNTIVGTPPYMAPEQEQGAVHRESDIYSLAVCFYEMLCGELPFPGVGAGMYINKANKRYTPIERLVFGLPKGIDEVFARAFEPDPHQRFRHAQEFAGQIESLA